MQLCLGIFYRKLNWAFSMNHWSNINFKNIYFFVELLMFSLVLFKSWVDSFTHFLLKGLFLKEYVKWSFLFAFIMPATVSVISDKSGIFWEIYHSDEFALVAILFEWLQNHLLLDTECNRHNNHVLWLECKP